MATNAITWMKNVGKSLGYASIDALKEYNPAITNMASTAKEFSSDLYHSIKDFKDTLNTKGQSDAEKSVIGQTKDVANELIKNVFDDLKTGNLYNKSRLDQKEQDMMTAMFGDFNFDFDDDFGDSDFGDMFDDGDEDNNISVDTASQNQTTIESTKAIINSMDLVGNKISTAVGNVTSKSINALMVSQRQSNKALYDMTNRGFHSVTVGLGAANASLGIMTSLVEPLTTHMQNSKAFYENSTKYQEQTIKLLTQIASNTGPVERKNKSTRTQNTVSDLITDGVFDVKAYTEMVKKNAMGYLDMITGLFDMVGGVKGAGNMVTGSPLQSVVTGAMKKLIPETLQASMKGFNSLIEGMFTTVLGSLKDKEFPGILGFIKDIFLPNSAYSGNRLRPGKFEKGKVDWDGISRQALTKVIPDQLSEIVRLLGGNYRKYDYNTGTWRTVADIKKDWKDRENSYARSAGGDFYYTASNALDKLQDKGGINSAQKELMKAQIEAYLNKAILSGDSKFLDVFQNNFNYKEFGLDEQTWKFMRLMFDRSRKNKKAGIITDMTGNIYTTRDRYGEELNRISNEGNDISISLFDGSIPEESKARTILGEDQYKHDVFFYLQGIYLHTKHVSDNLPLLITRGGSSRKVKGVKLDQHGYRPISDMVVPADNSQKNQNNGNNNGGVSLPNFNEDDANDSIDDALDIKRVKFNDQKLQDYYDTREAFKKKNPGAKWEDTNKYDPELEKRVNNETKFKGWLKGLGEKAKESSVGRSLVKFFDGLGNIIKMPAEKLDSLYTNMSSGLVDALYGTGNGDSLFEIMKLAFVDPRAAASKLGVKIKGSVVGKKGEDGNYSGGFLSGLINQTRDSFKSAGKWVKNQFTGGAANGRTITRSGIVSVSEGEMIIPAELNPFYHKKVNKANQRRIERINARKFFGFFDGGEEVVGANPEDTNADGAGRVKEDSEEKSKIGGILGAMLHYFSEGGKYIVDKVDSVVGNIKDKAGNTKEAGVVKEKIIDTLKEGKNNAGSMLTGALIGGGVSLLTGSIIGPIAGAGIGAATGLIINSKKVQHVLFGDVVDEETGEVSGGLLSKEVSNFMKKNVPSIAGGAVVGATGGLFMGSPILGAILGGTVGYIKSSNSALEYLFGMNGFGKDGADTGLMSKELQKRIKSAVPAMGAGAIAGLVAGPFGLVGNIMVGSALGYASSTDKFKNWLFGEENEDGKRSGGLVGMIKDNLISPIVGIFDKLTQEIKNTIKDTFHSLGKSIREFITSRLAKSKIAGAAKRVAGKAGKKLSEWGIKTPGAILKGINNKLGKRALRKGYSIRDRKNGGFMDAAARNQYYTSLYGENATRKGLYGTVDNILEGITDIDQLDDLSSMLGNFYDYGKETDIGANRAAGQIRNLLDNTQGMDKKSANRINKLIHSGKYDEAARLAESLGVDMDTFNNYSNAHQKNTSKRRRLDAQHKQLEKALGGNKIKDKDISHIQGLIEDEKKSKSIKTEEEKKAESADEAVVKVPKLLEDIITILLGDKSSIGDIKNKYKSTGVKQSINEKEEELSKINPGDTKEVNGRTMIYKEGEGWVDQEDEETDRKVKKSLISSLPFLGPIAGAFGKAKDFFGGIKEKLFGDGTEKKKGLFGNLFDKFMGEDSLISKVFNVFLGGEKGQKIKAVLSKVNLKTIGIKLLNDVVGPALFVSAFSGMFDGFFEKFGWGKNNKQGGEVYTDNNGNDYKEKTVTDENGNKKTVYKNQATGQLSDNLPDDVRTRQASTASFSEKLQYNTARGVLTNTKSVGSVVLGRTTIGKKMGNFVTKAAADGTESIIKNSGNMIIDNVMNGIGSFTKALRKVPILNGVADKIDDACLDICDKLAKKVASESAESLAKFAANAVIWIKVAFIANDFVTGYEDASTTLGVKDPSTGERVICGLLRAIKNFIPIIGTLLPDDVLIDIFVNYVGPFFGVDLESFKARRSAALEEAKSFGYDDWATYNKEGREDYTWTERTGNAFKSIGTDAKTKFNNIKKGIKEKGFGGYMKDAFTNMGTSFMESYKEEGGGLAGISAGIGKVFGDLLPGVMGEAAQKNQDIKTKALKGDLKGMWSITLDDFDGGKVKENGIETAVPSLFSKVIGQMPLIVNKLKYTPIALISKLFGGVKDGFMAIFDKVKDMQAVLDNEKKQGVEILTNPDRDWKEFFTIPELDKSNPLNTFIKPVFMINRLYGAAGAILGRVGKSIANTFGKIKDKVVNVFTQMNSKDPELIDAVKSGSYTNVWNVKLDDDDENPVSGIAKAGLFVKKLFATTPTMFFKIGNGIVNTFNKIKDKVVSSGSNINDKDEELLEAVKSGSYTKVWGVKFDEDEDNPVGGISKAGLFVKKLFATTPTLMYKIGNGVVNIFHKIADPIQDDYTSVTDKLKSLKDKKIMEIFKEKFEPTKGNVLGGIFEFGFGIGKVAIGLGKILGSIFDIVKDIVGDKIESIKNFASGVANFVDDKVQKVKNAVGSYVTGDETSASGSGFVSQLDPRYAKMSMGGGNVAQLGCGPAAAVMALNQYSGNMKSAVGLANQYQSGSGTDAAFFADYYARNGVGANYYDNRSAAGRSNIINSIASGSPVVLMGRDARNTSKVNSPFGPNNHYVVASGFDGRGNIIVNDPEARGTRKYSSKILNNATIGIGMSGRGSRLLRFTGYTGAGLGTRVDETTQNVWQFFRNRGFSEEATAGIMGNLQQESGIDPTRSQNGGPAKGIAQWESGRFNNLKDYAASRGTDWTDLDTQLSFIIIELNGLNNFWKGVKDLREFRLLTDCQLATEIFEKSFERAGEPNMEARYEYANYYLQQFAGKAFTYNPDKVLSNSSTSSSTSSASIANNNNSSSSSSSSSGGIGGILSTITSAFGKIGDIFNGSSNSETVNSSEIGSYDSNGNYTSGNSPITANPKGITYSGTTPLEYMKSIKGQLAYSQKAGERNPEGGSADCSSTVQWAIKKATGIDIGGYTGAQYNNKNLATVWYNSGNVANMVPTEAQPGDVLFFRRDKSDHVDKVGHVELYEGNNQMIGHGGGKNGTTPGPTEKSVDTSHLIKVARLVNDSSASGSGLLNKYSRNTVRNYNRSYSGGATGMTTSNTVNNSGITPAVAELLRAILAIAQSIVDNTKNVSDIYTVLLEIAKSKASDANELAAINAAIQKNMSNSSTNTDALSNLRTMVDQLLPA